MASWAKHEGLAEPRIVPLVPGLAFYLVPDEMRWLEARELPPPLARRFLAAGYPMWPECRLVPSDFSGWRLVDARGEVQFHVSADGAVTLPGDGALPEHTARGCAQADVLGLREAVRVVGGLFLAELLNWRPHVVGFRIEAGQLSSVRRYVRVVRAFSDAEVVLGGPTATSHPREVLEATGADYVFAGEAEAPFNLFLRWARQPGARHQVAKIPGLAYRYGGHTFHNTLPTDGYERTALDDAAQCGPTRQRELSAAIRPHASQAVITANRLDWSLVRPFRQTLESLYFTGGRGCPGQCTFCAQLHGRRLRIKPARQLLEEIEAVDAQVQRGTFRAGRWRLFRHADDLRLRDLDVSWAAVYDEDFFCDRRRALAFFRLWAQSPLRQRYRLSFQTNPCSLLRRDGRVDEELFDWIARLHPMVQLGAESFHPAVLARWRKRHSADQLRQVLDTLDDAGQDYTIFVLLADFDTTPAELLQSLRLLALESLGRPKMRIAANPSTIPLYDSELRRDLQRRGLLQPDRIRDFTDYERPQPGWLDPLVARMVEAADAELHFALEVEHAAAAVVGAVEAVVKEIRLVAASHLSAGNLGSGMGGRWDVLLQDAERARQDVLEARFRPAPPAHHPPKRNS